jgi:hypothetical protein
MLFLRDFTDGEHQLLPAVTTKCDRGDRTFTFNVIQLAVEF